MYVSIDMNRKGSGSNFSRSISHVSKVDLIFGDWTLRYMSLISMGIGVKGDKKIPKREKKR